MTMRRHQLRSRARRMKRFIHAVPASGVARDDFVWYASAFSRDEVLRRVRYLKPTWSFRSNFGYQNMLQLWHQVSCGPPGCRGRRARVFIWRSRARSSLPVS